MSDSMGRDIVPIRHYLGGDIPHFIRIGEIKMETKSALSSTTIQGSLLSILGAVATFLELSGKLPLGGASPVLAAIGGLFSLWGRFKAKTIISGIF